MAATNARLDRQIKSLIRKLRTIQRVEVQRANAKALNEVGKRSRTRVIRGVSKTTRLKQKDVRRRTFISRASAKKQRATLTGYAKPVSAVRLLTKNQLATRIGTGTNKRGVKAKGYDWPGAFIQRGRSGNVHVFQRKGSARYPIDVIKIDVDKPFQRNMKIVPKRVMKSDYKRLLQHELQYRLRKYTKR